MTPTLNPIEQMVLSAILDQTIIGGAQLMKAVRMSNPEPLIQTIKSLQSKDLIEVSGVALDESSFPYATFGVRPSVKEYAYRLLKSLP